MSSCLNKYHTKIVQPVFHLKVYLTNSLCIETGQEKPRSNYPGKVIFALEQVKMEVWLFSEQVKLASVVLLVIIANQNQDEQNNELKAWITL